MAHFNLQSHIIHDECDVSQRTVENAAAANYLLEVPRHPGNMIDVLDFACTQPTINVNGTHQMAVNGTNVADNSDLRHTPPSKPSCKINLSQRTFVSVPYLGRGRGDVFTESRLLQGESQTNRKSITQTSELDCSPLQYTPLLTSLEATISNPKHLVEQHAQSGWVRGGIPSRELTRDATN
ncbi:MAG: hypothetical protein CMB96_06120 [Flavobacteriaceae bacterium]|nr:hypothetical protein [Flavobacteriaceae bacterium]